MTLAEKVANRVAQARLASGVPILVGLCGPQGAGKSTLAGQVGRDLHAREVSTVVLSIDDFYMTKAERTGLGRRIHPLLGVRGPPGTHDIGLALEVIDSLLEGRLVAVPRFDKGADDRCTFSSSTRVAGPTDVVILEGWCVGARAQSSDALQRPVNTLEAEQDANRIWRTYVNDALAGDYQALFSRITLFALLVAPSFDAVPRWRQQQEHTLRRTAPSTRTMTDGEVRRFVQLYERLTRHVATEAPRRADIVVWLDEDRTPIKTQGL